MQPVVDRMRNIIWYFNNLFLFTFIHYAWLHDYSSCFLLYVFFLVKTYLFAQYKCLDFCGYQWSIQFNLFYQARSIKCAQKISLILHNWNLFYLITVPWIFHRCGSYDHYLYALNYKDHCCTYKISCGGSIYGSPAIDMVLYWFTVSVFMEYMQMGTINLVSSIASLQAQNIIYVASTSGLVTAVSFEVI